MLSIFTTDNQCFKVLKKIEECVNNIQPNLKSDESLKQEYDLCKKKFYDECYKKCELIQLGLDNNYNEHM